MGGWPCSQLGAPRQKSCFDISPAAFVAATQGHLSVVRLVAARGA